MRYNDETNLRVRLLAEALDRANAKVEELERALIVARRDNASIR